MYEISFGEWLRRQRKLLGLTQKQLAEQVHCAAITVRKIEAELRRPSIQIVEKLADALAVPPEERHSFVRFARGEGQVAADIASDLLPWRPTAKLLNANLTSEFLAYWESQRELSIASGMFLDANTFLVKLDDPAGRTNINPGHASLNSVLPAQQATTFMLMLIPVEVPQQIAPPGPKFTGTKKIL